MANFAILGVSGESKVWLVDFDNKTVESVDAATAQALSGAVQQRQNGAAVVRGIDLAVMANSRTDAASQSFGVA